MSLFLQVVPWKSEWTLPRRLLQKRLITSPQFHSEHDRHEEGIDVSTCHYQWLVKWCGLDYEHASWELENASLFLSSEARSLFKQYENRLERATGACNVELIKVIILFLTSGIKQAYELSTHPLSFGCLV